jgi:hypothetical protein
MLRGAPGERGQSAGGVRGRGRRQEWWLGRAACLTDSSLTLLPCTRHLTQI